MKSIVLTFGRFQPPTKGHEELLNFMKNYAELSNAEHAVWCSKKEGDKKNPLEYHEKISFMKEFFKDINIITEPTFVDVFSVLKYLSDNGYKVVTLVVGADRVEEFRKKIGVYIKRPNPKISYDFEFFEVISSGTRKEGISGSDMRRLVRENDFGMFRCFLPSSADSSSAIHLYDILRNRLCKH